MDVETLLISKIDQAIDYQSAYLTSGSCKDYADYRFHTGYIDGLASIRLDIVSLLTGDGDED